jgi:hypothetical protein
MAYEAPDQALPLLDSLHRPYAVLETEDFDHAIRALRNPVTLQIWLRNTALRMEIQPSADLYRGPEVRRL